MPTLSSTHVRMCSIKPVFWDSLNHSASYSLVKMNSLTLLLVTVALVGLVSAYPQRAANTMADSERITSAIQMLLGQQETTNEMADTQQTDEYLCDVIIPHLQSIGFPAARILHMKRNHHCPPHTSLGQQETTNEMADTQSAMCDVIIPGLEAKGLPASEILNLKFIYHCPVQTSLRQQEATIEMTDAHWKYVCDVLIPGLEMIRYPQFIINQIKLWYDCHTSLGQQETTTEMPDARVERIVWAPEALG